MSLIIVIVLTLAPALGLPLQQHDSEHNLAETSKVLTALPTFVNRNESATNETDQEDFGSRPRNSTLRANATDAILMYDRKLPEVPISRIGFALDCPLPTCANHNLGSRLQTGDEIAGRATSDPAGNGKK